MVNRLGIHINREEASVLLASADKNLDSRLTVDEFIDLICSQNETLNVDLNRIPRDELLTINQEVGKELVEGLRQDAEKQREVHLRDQMRVFVRKNLQPIAMDLLQLDEARRDVVDKSELMRVLSRRVRLPQFLKDDHEKMDELIRTHEDPEGRVRYKDFIAEIKEVSDERGQRKGRIGVGETQRSAVSSVGSVSEMGLE